MRGAFGYGYFFKERSHDSETDCLVRARWHLGAWCHPHA
uniref:Uncharacterized protein n=1 Tax=Arundo donax TaxID=35708 RepID=A0A0A9BSI5_ARUDO